MKENKQANICKSCSSQMEFDPNSQSLKCVHCGKLDVFDVQKYSGEKHTFAIDFDIDKQKVEGKRYLCKSCGRECVFGEEEQEPRCQSCGNKDLQPIKSIEYKPDGILPFKINEEKAIKCFFDWIKKRKFAPKDLKTLDRANLFEKVYVPVFSYDFDVDTSYSGRGVVYSYTRSDGRRVEKKEHFQGSRTDKYNNYLTSASSAIPSYTLRSLQPFSNGYYVYSPEFLYGFVASNIEYSLQDSFRDLTILVKNEIEKRIKQNQPYTHIESFFCHSSFSNIKYNYLYFPIYKGEYSYRGKKYRFFVNGENGNVTGNSPRSIWKTILMTIVIALGAVGLGFLISLFMR